MKSENVKAVLQLFKKPFFFSLRNKRKAARIDCFCISFLKCVINHEKSLVMALVTGVKGTGTAREPLVYSTCLWASQNLTLSVDEIHGQATVTPFNRITPQVYPKRHLLKTRFVQSALSVSSHLEPDSQARSPTLQQ